MELSIAIVVFVLLLMFILGILFFLGRMRRKPDDTNSSSLSEAPVSEEPLPLWKGRRKMAIDLELENVNAKLTQLRGEEPLRAKMVSRLRPYDPSAEQERLHKELRKVTNDLHGYPLPRPMVIAMPNHKILYDTELKVVEEKLRRLEKSRFPTVKVKTVIPATEGDTDG